MNAPPETKWSRWLANFKTIIFAVALALFIRIVLFEAFEIEGPSMEPTLLNGDRVVVAKFLYGLSVPFVNDALSTWGIPNRGDVVIIRSAENIDIVKRVIGLPGETIEIREDVVYIDGKPAEYEDLGPCRDAEDRRRIDDPPCEWKRETVGGLSHVTSHSIDSLLSSRPPQKVPPGHLYVLGDHRDRSNDSRNFGPVGVDRLKGRALFIYWSNENGVRWDRLGHAVE